MLGTATRQPGHFVVTGNILVTYAVGHLLDQGYPSDYDPALKQWRWETLPWLPEGALHKPREKTAQQLAVVGKLLKGAPLVVLATVAGREGELIGRELLDWFKYCGKAMRLWLRIG